MLKAIVSSISFIIWLVFVPIDLLLTMISPNNKLHKISNRFYYKKVRSLLTKEWASRISFTFTHGITHVLVFVIAAFMSWKLLNFNSSEVKNKCICVTAISSTKHKADTFTLNWNTGWEFILSHKAHL